MNGFSGEASTYTNWAPGEPNDYPPLGGEDHTEIVFDDNGRWNDLPYDRLLPAIVELPAPGATAPPPVYLSDLTPTLQEKRLGTDRV